MSIQLQEIQSIYISQNRLVEGKDYVRAEWLKADIPIGTTLMRLPVNSRDFEWKRKFIQLGHTAYMYGDILNYAALNNTYSISIYDNQKQQNIGNLGTNPTGRLIELIGTEDSLTIDNISVSLKGSIKTIAFDAVTNSIRKCIFLTSPIKVDGVTRYIPCQLLRDIPATLDANGKARVAGECGMVDSISGKFYGNVASSGAFTVENVDESGTVEDTRLHQIYTNKLVESKDYMIGDWLKADIPISTNMMSLPINSKNFEFERNFIQIMNPTYFIALSSNNTYLYFMVNEPRPKVWDDKYSRTVYTSSSVLGLGIHTIIANNDEVTISSAVNTATLPWYGETEIKILFNNGKNINKNTIHLTSSVKVDGVTRYVPCRLLRSIPRNLDAQCKSRQVGECGMIDLVSGRFYGNVASSGVFSLEWDEWLKDCSIQIAIPSCYAFNYTTRVDTTKLTSELVDFGFIKLSNTQIVYGDEDDGHVYTVDWGTNKWATLGINIVIDWKYVSITINGTTGTTFSNVPLDLNPHIYLYDIMQIKEIKWTIMVSSTSTTTTLTRYVDETTGQQGLISDQDGTIIYAD